MIDMLVSNEQSIIDAVMTDFENRSPLMTRSSDIMPTLDNLKHVRKHLKRWMKPERRSSKFPLGLLGARSKVEYVPMGVVGNISPWNFPIQLALSPMADIFGAGNRVMLKLSEFTPHTNAVIEKIFKDDMQAHCKIIQGGSDVAAQFSSLPFAHLLFTGSTAVGKLVMASASRNLTPLTLELGGKSPVIITQNADIKKAAQAILFGKMANAGQICVAPDYVFVPKALEHQLVQQLCELYKKHFKDGVEGKNLTSIISDAHYKRLATYLEQAQELGANIIKPLEQNQQDEQKHRMGLHLVTQVTDEMSLMQDELFGPILPIMSYEKLDSAIDYIKAHHHPLALYILGQDKHAQEYIIKQTISGTVAINDTLVQVTADDVPFGGVGHSGMGHYHGIEGFLTFSHAKNTLVSGSFNPRIVMLLKQSKLLIKLLKWLYIK